MFYALSLSNRMEIDHALTRNSLPMKYGHFVRFRHEQGQYTFSTFLLFVRFYVLNATSEDESLLG
jgi:hypothetical protein